MKTKIDINLFEIMDLVLHYLVGLALVILAGAVFFETIASAITSLHQDFMGTILRVLNDLLFVIILLEVLSTVTTHFREKGFALKPFLIVGTISAVRHILIVGARMSMQAEISTLTFYSYLAEIGANGLLTLILVIAYYVVSQIETHH